MKKGLFCMTLTTVLLLSQLASPLAAKANKKEGIVKLRLLETTDLHVFLANYDYYQTKEDNKVGLVKTASLIKQAKDEVQNSLLFDNGDHIQGNPLGDYVAKVKGLQGGEVHPVYRAFNLLGYDAITAGNHEFNYGLDFLKKALEGAKMPLVNANVYYANSDKHYFTPYVILKRTTVDEKGKKHPLRIGVIGLVPPQIMKWDKANLEGKVQTKSIVETAKKYVPIMKKKGADVIVALAHTGISSAPYTPDMENAAYYLTQINGLDAVFTGHMHARFPSATFKNIPNVNLEQGTINGKPVVMAGAFGSHLGLIDLELQKSKGTWKVLSSKAALRPIADEKGNSLVATDEKLLNAIKPEHEATIEYVNKPVRKTKAPIYSFLALVQDEPSVQIVNNAQLDYLQKKLKKPIYSPCAGIPILSAAAPFEAGGRNGPDYYTDIPAGNSRLRT